MLVSYTYVTMLKITGLTFSFRNRPLFDNLSFELNHGEILRISGPNGSGKSTLVGLLTGQISGGENHTTFLNPGDFREWTSWIAPDANGMVQTLSALENLSFWLQLRGIRSSHDHCRSVLDQWGLKGTWVQSQLPVGRFSTGMKRRLALARLELEDTKLWILDEPLFGLDDAACGQFRNTLSQHISKTRSAIVITHDDRLLSDLQHKTLRLGST